MTKPRLFTLGHSDRSIEQFVDVLERSSIRLVVDVRSNPASARYPWFERAALTNRLEEAGFSYRWMREFGGRKRDVANQDINSGLPREFRSYAVAMNSTRFHELCLELRQLASSTNLVLLCAEKQPVDCHRNLLADKLMLMGTRVVHIIEGDQAFDHCLHPGLSVEEGNRLVYRENQLNLL